MKKIYTVIISLFYFCCIQTTFAIDTKTQQAYQTFQTQIESRYSSEKVENILTRVQERLFLYTYEIQDTEKKQKLQNLTALNNELLFQKWKEKELDQSEQKIKEQVTRDALSKQLSSITPSSQVSSLVNNTTRKFIPSTPEREFLQGNEIFRIVYEKFYAINSQSIGALQNKTGIIIQSVPGEYRFIEEYSFEKKISYSEISGSFAGFFTPNFKIVEKNSYYYGYLFQNYKFYEDEYGAYQTQLNTSGFQKTSTFVYKDAQGRYNFITDATERRLISFQEIYGVSRKDLFLKYMLSDARDMSSDISANMKTVRQISNTIQTGKSEAETLQNIYAWILNNIEYSKNIDLNDMTIFSAGEAVIRKEGVCTAYTKLMEYFLLYHHFYDTEMIEGHVIDAPDFPKIGHAWVRVGERYFDPTFDDPVGATITRSFQEYRYFHLPKDIFYANRFLYDDLPDNFTTASKEQIHQYIFNVLSNLLGKYGEDAYNYLVFAPVKFRKTYNIAANTAITPDILSQKIGKYTVENDSFQFQQNGSTKNIVNFKYYIIAQDTTESTLQALNYEVSDMMLFDWQKKDGSREWRLAYELTTR